jgi:hypothetical protein
MFIWHERVWGDIGRESGNGKRHLACVFFRIAKMHTRLSGEQRTTVWGALLIFLSIQVGYA